MENIIVACITGAITLIGVLIANSKSQAVMGEKIDELSRRVERHNSVIERVYALETEAAVNEQRITANEARIKHLERSA